MMEIDSIDSKATKYRTYFSKMVRLSALTNLKLLAW